MNATSTVDVPGQLTEQNGSMVLRAVLMDCSYDKLFNSNLPSLICLLCKGCFFTKGDATGIIIRNRSGDMIKFYARQMS